MAEKFDFHATGGQGGRDPMKAVTLRPAEVWRVYGIPKSTTCTLCTLKDEARRMPSLKVPGRKGHKGARLIPHNALRAYLGLPPIPGI
jgi:hypothetical protein